MYKRFFTSILITQHEAKTQCYGRAHCFAFSFSVTRWKKKKVGVTRARVGKSTFSPIGFGQACKIF